MESMEQGATSEAVDSLEVLTLFNDFYLEGSTTIGLFCPSLTLTTKASNSFFPVGASKQGGRLTNNLSSSVEENCISSWGPHPLYFSSCLWKEVTLLPLTSSILQILSTCLFTYFVAIDEGFNPFSEYGGDLVPPHFFNFFFAKEKDGQH